MVTHYHGSGGPVAIAAMNYRHLASAHAKLLRERLDDSRDAEIAAMEDDLARRDLEYEAEQAASGGGDTMAAGSQL